jgi:hypothetical protein
VITEGVTHGINDSQWTADSVYDNKKINKWITEQNRIGWSQLINGWLAQSLTQAISDILKTQGTESWYLSGEKWTCRLIQIFWDTMLQLWNNRNKILYDGTQASTQDQQRERLNHLDKEDLMKEDLHHISAWLKMRNAS